MKKKIDRIYIRTINGIHNVIVNFDNNTTRQFTDFKTIDEAIDFKEVYKEKYGMSEAHEKRFKDWLNLSEDKHPMSK